MLMRIVKCAGLWCACLAGTALAAPDQAGAAKSFTRGIALLKEARLAEALAALGSAAQLDPAQAVYRNEYMLLRRTLSLRESLAAERDQARWAKSARALAEYYYTHAVNAELETIARAIDEREKSLDSAVVLAEACLAVDKPQEASQRLASFPNEKLSAPARIMLALALGRQRKAAEGLAVLAAVALPDDAAPRQWFDLARARVSCGDFEGGMKALAGALERTAPDQLAGVRAYAAEHRDFKDVAGRDAFAKALATASKVKASACSTGTDCGSCPLRGKCGGAGEQKAGEKAKAGGR